MAEIPEKPQVPFESVSRSVRETAFPPDARAVVAVLRGGQVPASLVAHHLGLPLYPLRIAFRDDANEPVATSPRLVGRPPELPGNHETVLLVDDVSVSGATFFEAKRYLGNRKIVTVVLKGRADIVLLPTLPSGCVHWPWNEE